MPEYGTSERNRSNIVERLQVETLKGQYFFRDLHAQEVYFEDFDDKSMNYFRLDFDVNFTFHAGKNLISIRGNTDTMVGGGEIQIEAVDAAGNLVGSNIYDLNDEVHSRVISIDITPETPAGDVTVTILGEARYAPDGTTIPQDWRGVPNMRWTRIFTAKPSSPNSSPIVYNDWIKPVIEVQEIQKPFYKLQFNQALSGSIGWNTGSDDAVFPFGDGNPTSSYILSTSVNTQTSMSYRKSGGKYFLTAHGSGSLLDFGGFTQDMTDGIVIIQDPQNPTPRSVDGYTSSPVYTEDEKGDGLFDTASGKYMPGAYLTTIAEVLSPFELRVNQPHTTWQGLTNNQFQEFEHFEFEPSDYELIWSEIPISYSASPTGSEGEPLLTSYAWVKFDNLEPLTGDVTRIKCYMKNHQAPFDWVLASDNAVDANELLYRKDFQKHRHPIGDMSQWGVAQDGTASLQQYWETAGVGTPNPSMSIFRQEGAGENPPVNQNLLVGTNQQALELDGTAFWWLRAKSSASFYENQWYELSFKSVSVRTQLPTWTTYSDRLIREPKMKLYMSGSAFVDGGDDYGKYIGKIEDLAARKKHVEFDAFNNDREKGYKFVFMADGTSDGTIQFKIDSGLWHIWDISIKPWDRKGYTPGSWDVIFPTIKCNVANWESIDFKFEFYNDAGDIANYSAVIPNVPFENVLTATYTNIVANTITALTSSMPNAALGIDCDSDINMSGSVYMHCLGTGATSLKLLTYSTTTKQLFYSTASSDDIGSGAGGNAFATINCPAGSDPVADSPTDTLNLAAGSYVTVTGNSGTDTVTIGLSSTALTYLGYGYDFYNWSGSFEEDITQLSRCYNCEDCHAYWVQNYYQIDGNWNNPDNDVPYSQITNSMNIPGFAHCHQPPYLITGSGATQSSWNGVEDSGSWQGYTNYPFWPKSGKYLECPTTIGFGRAAWTMREMNAERYSSYAERTWFQVNNWADKQAEAENTVKFAAIFNTTGAPIPSGSATGSGGVPGTHSGVILEDCCEDNHNKAGHGVKIMTSTKPVDTQIKTDNGYVGSGDYEAIGTKFSPEAVKYGTSGIGPATHGYKVTGGLVNAYYLAFYHWDNECDSPALDAGQQHFAGGIRKDVQGYLNSIIIEYSSDARLKEEIEPTKCSIDDLMNIRVRDFHWKNTPEKERSNKSTGFIAQELQEAYPQAAYGDEYGDPHESPMTVGKAELVPLLVKSIQDQQRIIEKLENRIEKLENK